MVWTTPARVIQLGIRENAAQFTLLVIVNGLVVLGFTLSAPIVRDAAAHAALESALGGARVSDPGMHKLAGIALHAVAGPC